MSEPSQAAAKPARESRQEPPGGAGEALRAEDSWDNPDSEAEEEGFFWLGTFCTAISASEGA